MRSTAGSLRCDWHGFTRSRVQFTILDAVHLSAEVKWFFTALFDMYVVHGLVEESLRRGGDFVTRQVRWCWRFFVIVDGVWFPGCVAWYVVSRCVEGCIVCLDVGLLVCACGMHWQRLVSRLLTGCAC